MRNLILALITLLPVVAAAAPSGGAHEIPWGFIAIQAANFIVVVALLIYFVKKPAAAHFKQRAESYNALLNKAEAARREAERNKKEISERLEKLEKNAQSSLVNAQSEAQDLKARILADANSLSQKLQEEARRTVEFEVQRAKEDLRKELLVAALEDAQATMEKDVKDQDLKRLQTEFVQRVQVVR